MLLFSESVPQSSVSRSASSLVSDHGKKSSFSLTVQRLRSLEPYFKNVILATQPIIFFLYICFLYMAVYTSIYIHTTRVIIYIHQHLMVSDVIEKAHSFMKCKTLLGCCCSCPSSLDFTSVDVLLVNLLTFSMFFFFMTFLKFI